MKRALSPGIIARGDPDEQAGDVGGGDDDEPEPEEDVDLLVEEVERKRALDGVAM